MGARRSVTALADFSRHPLITVRGSRGCGRAVERSMCCVTDTLAHAPCCLAGQKLGGHPKAISTAVIHLRDTGVSGVLASIDTILERVRAPDVIRVCGGGAAAAVCFVCWVHPLDPLSLPPCHLFSFFFFSFSSSSVHSRMRPLPARIWADPVTKRATRTCRKCCRCVGPGSWFGVCRHMFHASALMLTGARGLGDFQTVGGLIW